MPFRIIYENKDFLVVEKPPFLSTEELINQIKKESASPDGTVGAGPRRNVGASWRTQAESVHRIDTNTSGLLIIALNKKIKKYFQEQFQKGLIEKKYLALVKNHLIKKQGVINYPMVKVGAKHISLTSPRKQFKDKPTREAITYYKVLENNKDFALLEVTPKTGRTHQVRSHLASSNHYIVGDYRYGPKNQKTFPELNRHFLHAYYLKFKAPNGKEIELKLKLPEDLQNVLKTVKLS